MKKPQVCLSLSFFAFLGSFALRAEVQDCVDITIKPGWNAFYLPVTPSDGADAVFEEWPTDSVGFYDQAAFLRTKQFTKDADDGSMGAADPGVKQWFRGDPGRSSFRALVANGIYLFKATNATAVTKRIYGSPAALRTSWHVCQGTNDLVNYVGIATDGETATLTEKYYFQGLDTGWTYERGLIREPKGKGDKPILNMFSGLPTGGNLAVVAMDASKVSDWSGVLNVTPAYGLSFGTNVCQGVLSVRNDSGTNRLVRVSMRHGFVAEGAPPPMPVVNYFDTARSSAWQTNLFERPYVRELVAGETLQLRLAVDRTAFAAVVAGIEYGGLVTVADVSTEFPSHFATTIPFSILSDGGAFLRTQWPKGLWAATLSLDKVSFFNQEKATGTDVVTEPLPAGSTMSMRLLVCAEVNGDAVLLQRARINGRRISSVVLPTDDPLVIGSGSFGRSVLFAWNMDEHSRVNPFKHARHPDHDGLDAYFEKQTPSGDDFGNYLNTVKPELFSISNEVSLVWNANGRAAAWSPEETLDGTCTWVFRGLRREGPIVATGSFAMKRISPQDIEEIRDGY